MVCCRPQLLTLNVAALSVGFYCAVNMHLARADEAAPTADEMTLVRVPPISVEEAQKSFELADGFRMELAAAEPLVVDPVAMAFDEAGRLYVVEMIDYSERDQERLGRVCLLTDTDG